MQDILPYIVKNMLEDEKFLAKLKPELKREVDKYEAIRGGLAGCRVSRHGRK